MRLFCGILLPDDVRHQLAGLVRQWGRKYPPAKWVPPENLHLTLKFFGEVNDREVKPLCDALSMLRLGTPRGSIAADHVECLPPNGPVRILSIGIGGDVIEVYRLFEAVEHAAEPLGFRRESRRFRPHITLARLRDPLPKYMRQKLIAAADGALSPSPFKINEFVLMQSILGAGTPEYRTIARFALG